MVVEQNKDLTLQERWAQYADGVAKSPYEHFSGEDFNVSFINGNTIVVPKVKGDVELAIDETRALVMERDLRYARQGLSPGRTFFRWPGIQL